MDPLIAWALAVTGVAAVIVVGATLKGLHTDVHFQGLEIERAQGELRRLKIRYDDVARTLVEHGQHHRDRDKDRPEADVTSSPGRPLAERAQRLADLFRLADALDMSPVEVLEQLDALEQGNDTLADKRDQTLCGSSENSVVAGRARANGIPQRFVDGRCANPVRPHPRWPDLCATHAMAMDDTMGAPAEH